MHKSIMQKALGEQWHQLPPALKTHYQYDSNFDIGFLDITYPKIMYPYLTFLHWIGALINRQGSNIPTTVKKQMRGDIQYWNRVIQFPQGKTVFFNSIWIHLNRGHHYDVGYYRGIRPDGNR